MKMYELFYKQKSKLRIYLVIMMSQDVTSSSLSQTLESTLKASINSMLPTCDDKGVFFTDDVDAYRPGNSSSLQCKEVGRRKAEEQVVVTWAYSMALVWLV